MKSLPPPVIVAGVFWGEDGYIWDEGAETDTLQSWESYIKKKKNENRKYNQEKEIASTINIQIKEFHQDFQPHHILDVSINTLSCLGIYKI